MIGAAFSGIAIVGGIHPACAATNPLNVVEADNFSAKSPPMKTEPCSEGGTNLASVHDGDYAEYPAFDFDSGVAAVKFRVSSARESGTIEVHLDSLQGPLMATCSFKPTGGWQSWQDTQANVDNSQAGVRDVFLVFHGPPEGALVNLSHFVFLKSVAEAGQKVDLTSRLDKDDDEPQATQAWGIPESGFTDNFESGDMSHWRGQGLVVTDQALSGSHSLAATGTDRFSPTPRVFTSTKQTPAGSGVPWRKLLYPRIS